MFKFVHNCNVSVRFGHGRPENEAASNTIVGTDHHIHDRIIMHDACRFGVFLFESKGPKALVFGYIVS